MNGTSKVQLQFKSFATEQGYDTLFIYNGASTAAPLMGAYTGTNSPGTVTSTGTVITLRFKSDNGITNSGFKLIFNCVNSTGLQSPENFSSVFTIFPNPAASGINILSETKIESVSILNLMGQVLHTEKENPNRINLEQLHLSEGVYLLEIQSLNSKQTSKFIY